MSNYKQPGVHLRLSPELAERIDAVIDRGGLTPRQDAFLKRNGIKVPPATRTSLVRQALEHWLDETDEQRSQHEHRRELRRLKRERDRIGAAIAELGDE